MSLQGSIGHRKCLRGSAEHNSRSSPFYIPSPPRARHHLSKGMRLAALRHTEMVGVVAVLRAAMSTATESVLGCSPNNTFRMEVVDELPAEFQKNSESALTA
jgi:hypothetical protein